MTEISEIKNQADLDRYWAERGGSPQERKDRVRELADAEQEVIAAALSDVGPGCPYIRLKAAVLRLVELRHIANKAECLARTVAI
jgi:hypothetical protein